MTTPTRIAATFATLKAAGHMAFMPFVTVGDPDVTNGMKAMWPAAFKVANVAAMRVGVVMDSLLRLSDLP